MIIIIFKIIANVLLFLSASAFLTACVMQRQMSTPSVVQSQYNSSESSSKRQRPLYNKIILNKIQNSQGQTILNKKYSILNKDENNNQTDDIMYIQNKLNKIEQGEIKIAQEKSLNKQQNIDLQEEEVKKIEEKKLPKTIISSKEVDGKEAKIHDKITNETQTKDTNLQQNSTLSQDLQKVEVLSNTNQDDYVIKPKSVFPSDNNSEAAEVENNTPTSTIITNITQQEQIAEEKEGSKQTENKEQNTTKNNQTTDKSKSILQKNIVANLKSLDSNADATKKQSLSKPIPKQSQFKTPSTQESSSDDIIMDEDTKLAMYSKFSPSKKSNKNFKPAQTIDNDGIIMDSATNNAIQSVSTVDDKKIQGSKTEKENSQFISQSPAPIKGIIANRVAKANASKQKKSVLQMQQDEIDAIRKNIPYKVMAEDKIPSGSYSVQIGSYETEAELLKNANSVSQFVEIFVQPVIVGGKNYYRIKTTPVSNKKDADKTLYLLIKNGYYDIFIARN